MDSESIEIHIQTRLIDMTLHPTDHFLNYLDGQLDAETRLAIETHLADCETCRAELASMQETVGALSTAAREVQRLPVHTLRSWAIVRSRLHTPLVARVRYASGRFSLQAALSLAVVTMLFLSGVSLNLARAASPTVPFIQTPGTALHLVDSSDTPTLSVTHALNTEFTPTLTLTPIPDFTN